MTTIAASSPMAFQSDQSLDDIIQLYKSHPEKYRQMREKVMSCGDTRERVKTLLDFATSESELSGMMPRDSHGSTTAGITVTVVTVVTIIPGDTPQKETPDKPPEEQVAV